MRQGELSGKQIAILAFMGAMIAVFIVVFATVQGWGKNVVLALDARL